MQLEARCPDVWEDCILNYDCDNFFKGLPQLSVMQSLGQVHGGARHYLFLMYWGISIRPSKEKHASSDL